MFANPNFREVTSKGENVPSYHHLKSTLKGLIQVAVVIFGTSTPNPERSTFLEVKQILLLSLLLPP